MTLHHGDCLDVMAAMGPESVDAIVTDPPYGLEFMGVAWDTMRDDGTPRTRNEWGDFGSREHARGQHDAHRVGRNKAVALQRFSESWAEAAYRVAKPSAYLLAFGGTRTVHRMTCAIEDAGWVIRDQLMWVYLSGFPKSRASLKPAYEPIVLARKPGPLRDLDIEGCRIAFADDGDESEAKGKNQHSGYANPGSNRDSYSGSMPERTDYAAIGRWPSNVLMLDPVLGPETSRVFVVPKADRADREPVLGGLPERADPFAGTAHSKWCEACGKQAVNVPGSACECAEPKWTTRAQRTRANVHPTVKPVDLMRHLVRLVTPTGGIVLDPFAGSGSTLIAAEMEGFAWVGIEREAEYVAIAEARLNGTQRGLGLPA